MKKLPINYSTDDDNSQLINHLKQLNNKYSNTKFIKNRQIDLNKMKKNITPMILPNSESNINSINNNHLIQKHTPSQFFNYKSRENMNIKKQNPPMIFSKNYNILNIQNVEFNEGGVTDISFKIINKKNNINEKNNTSLNVNSENKIKIFPPLYYINPYYSINIKDISSNFYEIYDEYSYNSFIHEDEQLKILPRGKHTTKPVIHISLLEKFILIVDFNNLGGGTSFFIESIVSRYKKYQTFLIVRNTKEGIYFTVNDEYQFEKLYNNEDASTLLINNKHKIEKIFVNHILDHVPKFIHNLFYLNVKIDTITHDYYNIFNDTAIYFNSVEKYINNSNKRCYIDINKYDNIITQNKGNLCIYNNFIKDNNNKIIVSTLPDYKNPKEIVHTSNDNIIIGILGNIDEIKGLCILKTLIDFYKNDKNIKFVVFGVVNIYPFRNFYKYNTISELNLLLTTHKPNILIELSITPETYSYTLSLAMITKLPILYLKKNNYCTVENRLSKYDKAYAFTTLEHFNALIYEKKQHYFYTIEPIIYFNKFWDEYFGKIYTPNFCIISNSLNDYNNKEDDKVYKLDTVNKNIVLVVSKINTSYNPFTYVNKRSIYTIDERFIQTLNTLDSVRKKIPNAFIVLVDNSKLNDDYYNTLCNKTDYFINITDDKDLNYYTDECIFKAFGEISQQLIFYKHFLSKIDVSKTIHFFKITGRYYINDTFDYNIFDNDLTIFKKNDMVTDRDYYYTSFYKISNKNVLDYFKLLVKIMNERNKYMLNNKVQDYEVFMPPLLCDKVIVSHLGITQIFSCWNTVDNI